MKCFSAAIAGLILLTASQAFGGSRVFIIANPADDKSTHQCLANGAKCGAKAASSYCLSQDYDHADTYRRIDPDEVTGSGPRASSANCPKGDCNDYVAIICRR